MYELKTLAKAAVPEALKNEHPNIKPLDAPQQVEVTDAYE